MTDRDVEREIEANEERARRHAHDDDVEEGGIIGKIERVLDPFAYSVETPEDEDAERQREANDADQRPDD